MNHWSSAAISLFLLACASALIVSHLRAWRSAAGRQVDPEELDYCRRQFRRRMQTSLILALLAVAIFAGELLTPWVGTKQFKQFAMFFWGGVMVALLWVAVLAVMDLMATRRYYSQVRRSHRQEQAKLQTELRRLRSRDSNGKARLERPKSNGQPRE
ncbi:MAG: hypothetical protein ABSG68_18560 [Thermoguttaceae bacterium]|jgi:heme exporter protein D